MIHLPQCSSQRAPLAAAASRLVSCAADAYFDGYRLTSAFQPIVSLSLQRVVGHEALLRAYDEADQAVAPPALFARFGPERQRHIDVLTHRLHLGNFRRLSGDDGWVFLNMTPEVFLHAGDAAAGASFGETLSALGIPAQRVVIELLEKDVSDSLEFEHAVGVFRELGCLIALDDFGAGSSNFDRVWSLRPKIVKLDRSLIHQAARTTRVRRVLPQLVSLLHEAGAMVLVEGVESAEEAYMALDANADFAQGYLFGRPAPALGDAGEATGATQAIWQMFDRRASEDAARRRRALAPYINAIGNASVLLSAGRPSEEACAEFLALPESSICYLLDERGQQLGINHWGHGVAAFPDPRLSPLNDTRGARWSRSPYFRRAIEHFGKVQITRPYLSVSSGGLCVTVSVSFKCEGRTRVICGDMNLSAEAALPASRRIAA